MKIEFLLVLLLSLSITNADETSQTGIEVVDSQSVLKLLAQKPKLLLFFADRECPNCQQCSNIYALVNQQQPQTAYYAKIYLTQSTTPFFIKHNITDLPRIVVFNSGKPSPHHFQCLGTSNTLYRQMKRWIYRLDNSLREWGHEEDHEHQLIVHCNSDQLKKMWKRVERNQLWLDLFCGSQQFMGDNLAVVSAKGHSIEAWQFSYENTTQFQSKMSRLIRAYKFKFVLNWNTAIIQQTFFHNQSAFVMLINEQSQSMAAYEVFEAVKQQWYEDTDNYEPTIFAVSELHKDTYETTKLKRYLTGVAGANRNRYFYPMLAFIYQGARTQKYVMKIATPKTKQNIEKWMQSIHEHIILGKPYKDGEDVLTEWFNEDVGQKKNSQDSQQYSQQNQEEAFYIKKQSEWKYYLSKQYKKPFFVYFSWRYDYEMQKRQSEVVLWWQEKQKDGVSPNMKIKLIVHLMHSVDIPNYPGLSPQYVPSLAYIDEKKNVEMLQGVTDFDKIKQFYQYKLDPMQTKKQTERQV